MEVKIQEGCGVGCLFVVAIMLTLLALGIIAIKYAWAFLVWAWNLVVVL